MGHPVLPPALAQTIAQLPAVMEGKTVAVVCSGFTCQPPVGDAGELARMLGWDSYSSG